MPIFNSRIHLVSCIGIDHEFNYLSHFLAHYLELGVPPANFHVVINTVDADSSRLAQAKDIAAAHGLPEPDVWIGPYSSKEMWQRRRLIQRQNVPAEHWVLNADADEFHEYPDDLATILSECESRGVNCIQGPMVDRVAATGELLAVPAAGSIWEAFPIEANVPYLIGQIGENHGLMGSLKVMALKGNVLPLQGGHRPDENDNHVNYMLGRNLRAFRELRDPMFRFSIPFKVHHFKWAESLLSTLSSRNKLSTDEQPPASLEYGQKISDYFERHGKVCLADLPIRQPNTYVYRSWRRRVAFLRARGALDEAGEKPRIWVNRLRKSVKRSFKSIKTR